MRGEPEVRSTVPPASWCLDLECQFQTGSLKNRKNHGVLTWTITVEFQKSRVPAVYSPISRFGSRTSRQSNKGPWTWMAEDAAERLRTDLSAVL